MQASSIDLMYAKTEAESAVPSWMNIRFDHTLLPAEEAERREAENGSRYPDEAANDLHPAIDPHARLSSVGRSH